MPLLAPPTGVTITNPLVLYRSLLATKQIDPDPAQHRLAIHLQKIYHRLLDYDPEVEYSQRIKQLSRTISTPASIQQPNEDAGPSKNEKRGGVVAAFKAQREAAEAMALVRKLTSHEAAMNLQTPQGLLLYGEVGTGKSMLVDLLADCLPNKKKRRWHFNTFMLETFAKLEQLRRSRLNDASVEAEHSLLWLARDIIATSPILFLDEFQLPDRATSKILSSLLTSFFQLGGVLIATSNRMPEELAKASGVEFAPPPSSRLGLLGNRFGILGKTKAGGRSENSLGAKGDFAAFLEVLRSRCEVFEIEGSKDWRRQDSEDCYEFQPQTTNSAGEGGFHGLDRMASGNVGLGFEQSSHVGPEGQDSPKSTQSPKSSLPKYYAISSQSASSEEIEQDNQAWGSAILTSISYPTSVEAPSGADLQRLVAEIPWERTSLQVYGRDLIVPRHMSGVTKWTFAELCCRNLGPADYISLTSTFHTFILDDVPVLSLLLKNEARRLITLLDALYEARCKLLIRAAAGPDNLFFPEIEKPLPSSRDGSATSESGDTVYSETFSEIYQDTTSPFRPNVSSYTFSASSPSYTSSALPSSPYSPSPSTRSMLADEDSDFGPTYGAGRRANGTSDGAPGAGNEIGRQSGPDFGHVGIYTGEDERFAYKRARSRLWEMCSAKWWNKGNHWKPLSRDIRHWESSDLANTEASTMALNEVSSKKQQNDEKLFRHGASPFRTAVEPPPKFSWTHAWGMMKWGKKAGTWGQGPEGLKDRAKAGKAGNDHDP